MKVIVNDRPIEFDGKSIADLVGQLSLPATGVAVAVDMDIVPRSEWATFLLTEGARLMIIKAASGG